MNFSELSNHRQSTRSYQVGKPVEPEIIKKCLEIIRLAPSSRNCQLYHFTVISGQIAQCAARLISENFSNAHIPAFIVISKLDCKPVTAGERDYREVDIGIAAAYFTLAAAEAGLGTCILGGFDESGIQQLLNLQDRILLLIAVGYASPDEFLRSKQRKSLQELVTWVE